MQDSIGTAIATLCKNHALLQFTFKDASAEKHVQYSMPAPIVPHVIGDIIITAQRSIPKEELFHRQTYFVLLYAHTGKYSLRTETGDDVINPGQIYLGQPYARYCLHQREDAKGELITIMIKPELILQALLPVMPDHEVFLNFFLSPLKDPKSRDFFLMDSDGEANALIRFVMDMLVKEYVNRNPGYQRMLDSALVMLFSLLARSYRSTDKLSPDTDLLSAILKYLSKNCASVTLRETAEKFSYHPNYLSTILQRKSGKTFSELIRDYRLERATTLLIRSTLSIEEIAVLVGYPHGSNFYKVFRQKFDMTPHQYRERYMSAPPQPDAQNKETLF